MKFLVVVTSPSIYPICANFLLIGDHHRSSDTPLKFYGDIIIFQDKERVETHPSAIV